MAKIRDTEHFYRLIFDAEEELSSSYDCMPPTTLDDSYEISAAEDTGLMKFDHSSRKFYADPSISRMTDDELKTLFRYGLTHSMWHPNHGLGYRTDRFDSAVMTSMDGVEEYQPRVKEKIFESDSIESKINFIYKEAVEDFKNIFDTEFKPPKLGFEQPVMENCEDKTHEVGYSIEDETNNIILNTEILDELHPDLLLQDFRHMLKKYHDISLQKSVEKDVIPYVKNLHEDNDLSVRSIYFTDIENGQADYNNSKQRIRVDYSRLKDFNPETGKFESGFDLPGGSIKLHEVVHDLDFTNNQHTRNYNWALDDRDLMDPRNAIFEAPTTFEVYMAGWETRENAIAAFKDPLLNHDFFDGYPALDIEEEEPGTIQDPYNMGLVTSLSLHDAMISIHGFKEGTKKTRNILYKNFWDLEKMGRVLEAATEQRDVPNVPRHKRKMQEIARSENAGEKAAEEARDILDRFENAEDVRELLWLDVQGSDIMQAYEQNNSFANAPEPLEDLDLKLVDLGPIEK